MGVFYFTEFIETSNTSKQILNRQTISAKIYSQKGNSPDYILRPLKIIKWQNCDKM